MAMRRGEIWWASVLEGQIRGREQHNEPDDPRPWVVLSDGRVETNAGLIIACPITTRGLDRLLLPPMDQFRLHITPDMIDVTPTDRGIPRPGVILVDQLRAMSVERFRDSEGRCTRLGKLKTQAMAQVDGALIRVLRLPA